MANIKLKFYQSDRMEEGFSDGTNLECYKNHANEIYISIQSNVKERGGFICLDKDTAIKLVKVIKSEISKIEN